MGKGNGCMPGSDDGKLTSEEIESRFKRPYSRGCTDVLCCLGFAMFLLAMVGVMFTAMGTADMQALFNGMDVSGCTCGKTYAVCTKNTCEVECKNTNNVADVDKTCDGADWSFEKWEEENSCDASDANPFTCINAVEPVITKGMIKRNAYKRVFESRNYKGDCEYAHSKEEDNCKVVETAFQCQEAEEGEKDTVNLGMNEDGDGGYAALWAQMDGLAPGAASKVRLVCTPECPGGKADMRSDSDSSSSSASSSSASSSSSSSSSASSSSAASSSASSSPARLLAEKDPSMDTKDNAVGVIICRNPEKYKKNGGVKVYEKYTKYVDDYLSGKIPAGTCGLSPPSNAVGSYCAPDPDKLPKKNQFRVMYNKMQSNGFTDMIGSIYAANVPIIIALFVAILVGMLWLKLMQKCVGVMAWSAIVIIIMAFFGGGYMLHQNAAQTCAETEGTCGDAVVSKIVFGIGAAVLVFTIFMFKRIKLAIGCMKEASRCIQDQPSMMLFPGFQFIAFFAFMLIWLFGSVNLAASGDIIPKSPLPQGMPVGVLKTVRMDPTLYNMCWFWLFAFFWVTQFIVAFGELVLAGATAAWYFRPLSGGDDGDRPAVENPMKEAAYRAYRYHLGSVAFGSLIIAIIKMIRAMLTYIQKKAPKENKVVKVILCILQSCMYCLEKCMKFINRNAYIIIAIYGDNFCTAARKAFGLILRNIARIGAIAVFSLIFLFLGKMVIMGVPTFLSFVLLTQGIFHVDAPFVPLMFIALACYGVGVSIMNVYGMTIDTMLQCFVADEEMSGGSPKYADGALSEFVSASNKDAQERGIKADYAE